MHLDAPLSGLALQNLLRRVAWGLVVVCFALTTACLSGENALPVLGDTSDAGMALDGFARATEGSIPSPDAARPEDEASDSGADAPHVALRVGGHVSGLAGRGLVLQDNGADDLALAGDGSFVFAKAIAPGATYFVTVRAQPSGPDQSCEVANGSGRAERDVSDIAITCATLAYPVGGTVAGLSAISTGGLVLANARPDGGVEKITVGQNGSFAFPTNVQSGAAYAVTVDKSPASPAQTCVARGGTGTVVSGGITSVVVDCATNAYAVGGTITGLAGQGLVLRNGADTVSINANGTFGFPSLASSGSSFTVTVATQPTSPSQTCTVTGGAGVIGSSDVTSVIVSCQVVAYPVGGTVTGLAGSGLVLQNGAETLPVASDGAFVFPAPVKSGEAYSVVVSTQPTNPSQSCQVVSGDGIVSASPVTSARVLCTTTIFPVGGVVTGLAGTGLTLTLNGGSATPLSTSGAFTFAPGVASGAAYVVGVQSQPTNPEQTCTIANPSGTIAGAAVSDVVVDCVTNRYPVGGSISGLVGNGLVLTDNGGDALAVAPGASTFVFPAGIASGQGYDVRVASQPTNPTQACSVSGGGGTVVGGAVASVTVNCGTSAFALGGSVTGLAGKGLVLQNGASSVSVNANGSFAFGTLVQSGASYAVTVRTQPTSPSQSCVVTKGAGVVGGADVGSVEVACSTDAFRVGGVVKNLLGAGLVLQNNGGDDSAVGAGGVFTFATPIASGAPYAVTVRTQPTSPWQTCTVTNAAGNVGNAPLASVQVDCATNGYFVGGTVVGLAGAGLAVTLNGGNAVNVSSDGTFRFAPKLQSGAAYSVAIQSQPSAPSQSCTLAGASGTVAGNDVSDVAIRCTTSRFPIGGTATGLLGSGLVLTNGNDTLSVPAGATTFTFPTAVASGQTYYVQIAAQPSNPTQACTLAGGQGSVGSAAVTTVTVNCTSRYTLSGTVFGLKGSGLTLTDDGGTTTIPVTGTSFSFPPIASGTSYDVRVATQPTSPWQTCVVSSPTGVTAGTITGNIATLNVTCVSDKHALSGTVTGLTGSNLVLSDGFGHTTTLNAGATAFSIGGLDSGASFDVQVANHPDVGVWETCKVTSQPQIKIIQNTDVTGVTVDCSANQYTITGSITGMHGVGLHLNDGTGADLWVGTGATSFAFPALASGTHYGVVITSSPVSPIQSCTVAGATSGAIANGNVSLSIDCSNYTPELIVFNANATPCATISLNDGVETISAPLQSYVGLNGGEYSQFVTFKRTISDQAGFSIHWAAPPSDPYCACAANATSVKSTSGTISGDPSRRSTSS